MKHGSIFCCFVLKVRNLWECDEQICLSLLSKNILWFVIVLQRSRLPSNVNTFKIRSLGRPLGWWGALNIMVYGITEAPPRSAVLLNCNVFCLDRFIFMCKCVQMCILFYSVGNTDFIVLLNWKTPQLHSVFPLSFFYILSKIQRGCYRLKKN